MRTPDENAELIALAMMLNSSKMSCDFGCGRFPQLRFAGYQPTYPDCTDKNRKHLHESEQPEILPIGRFVRRFGALLAKGDRL